ncbi:family 43 glycosylhydrolase [Streptomyces sp. NPDC090106]|uniref:family 43 glycosylhydrolase n=1 Tax=Streptomyces sp. NPDC090106 TaxID=3365946 RepID=UPI00380C86E2
MTCGFPSGETPDVNDPQYAGHVFFYFTGEDTADGEQIRCALSRGDDPLHWRELNQGRPVVVSDIGERGVRDPFVLRSPGGDRFFLLATDLRMYRESSGSWDEVQVRGSRSVVIWESTDLVHWTDRRLVVLAPEGAGDAWAPKACYDPALGRYVVFWASRLRGSDHHTMLYATTEDFRTFSEPEVWHDPGHSVIDSAVVAHDGAFYRFTKDERDPSSAAPGSKFITVEKAASLTDRSYALVADGVGAGVLERGEGPAVFRSNSGDRWYLFIDEYGGRGYVPFETDDLDSGRWTPCSAHLLPAGARHGSVLPVTREEYDRLLAAFPATPASVVDATVAGQTRYAVVTEAASRVVLPVEPDADLTALAPEFAVSEGASTHPASGTRLDLSTPRTYTVTAADGTRRDWTVEAVRTRGPVLPGLLADPDVRFMDGGFWVYPTTDGFPGWGGTRFSAYSSPDLVNWTDHGVILDLAADISWADRYAWAPAIAERDGRYYLYFCAEQQIGVAVADSPAGPFTDALGKPLIAKDGAWQGQMIDPAVFTDADGTSYLYWGNTHGYVVPLNDDMVSFDAGLVRDITPEDFREAFFVIERKGTYYLMWSEDDTRSEDYHVAYATGPSPLGPWEKRGTVLSKRPEYGILGTGHHSVVNVPGTDEWYVVYHRFALNGPGRPGGDGVHRETTIDRLWFAADGTLQPVVPTLEGIGPVRPVS